MRKVFCLAVLVLLGLSAPLGAFAQEQASAQQQWSMGYWTPWGNPGIPPSAIEWGGLTHVVHAWALVRANGSLDLETQRVSGDGPVLVNYAHSNGVKAILGIGQPYFWGQTTNLQQAVTQNRSFLVNNIMTVVNSYGFDGVDIDWEPFNASVNGPAMQAFAADLRAQLGPGRTLTAAAIVTDYPFWGSVHSYFDRISVMTYDMSGTWDPYTWHNSALYDHDNMVWSINLAVNRYIAYGVPASKLSIGIPFFGYKWTGPGILGPQIPWTVPPLLQQIYYQNLAGAITPQNYRWDGFAKVPYLSVDGFNDNFYSYDNEQSIVEKIRYAENRGLGGWIIWELFGDYFPSQTPNQPLLTAIKNARTPTTPTVDTTPPTVVINQAAGQADPSSNQPIYFSVVFSEPVAGFTSGDVTLSGTAPGIKTVTVTGSGASYTVAVSGLTWSGTVIATIAPGVAADAAGNANTASTSSDNSVYFKRKGLLFQ